MTLRLFLLLSILLHLGLGGWAIVRGGPVFRHGDPEPREASFVLSPFPLPALPRATRVAPSRTLSGQQVTEISPPPRRSLSSESPPVGPARSERSLGYDEVLAEGNLPPEYPAEAEQRGWEGLVRVRLWIDAGGSVRRVEVAQPSGHGILDAAATDAARAWKFPSWEELRLSSTLVVSVTFRLE